MGVKGRCLLAEIWMNHDPWHYTHISGESMSAPSPSQPHRHTLTITSSPSHPHHHIFTITPSPSHPHHHTLTITSSPSHQPHRHHHHHTLTITPSPSHPYNHTLTDTHLYHIHTPVSYTHTNTISLNKDGPNPSKAYMMWGPFVPM